MNINQVQVLRAMAEAGTPQITQEEFERFFSSPCWFGLRQLVASELNDALDLMFNPTIEERHKTLAQGIAQGLLVLFESQDKLEIHIQDNMQNVANSAEYENMLYLLQQATGQRNNILRDLQQMVEKGNNERRTANPGPNATER